jgi:hypothetical protein
MNGWISVSVIIGAQIAVAIFLVRLAAQRWWEYPVIAALTAVLVRPTERRFTGDVSVYLPASIWSEGGDGKDQIIDASVASTFLLPLIASALVVFAVKLIWRATQRPSGRDGG